MLFTIDSPSAPQPSPPLPLRSHDEDEDEDDDDEGGGNKEACAPAADSTRRAHGDARGVPSQEVL